MSNRSCGAALTDVLLLLLELYLEILCGSALSAQQHPEQSTLKDQVIHNICSSAEFSLRIDFFFFFLQLFLSLRAEIRAAAELSVCGSSLSA